MAAAKKLPTPAAPEPRTKVLEAQLHALKVERDFWVEQARTLQNQLQTVMRGQAAMLEQMANTSMTSDDVQALCGQIAHELRQPLTTVEASAALAAAARGGSQGRYTPVSGRRLTPAAECRDPMLRTGLGMRSTS